MFQFPEGDGVLAPHSTQYDFIMLCELHRCPGFVGQFPDFGNDVTDSQKPHATRREQVSGPYEGGGGFVEGCEFFGVQRSFDFFTHFFSSPGLVNSSRAGDSDFVTHMKPTGKIFLRFTYDLIAGIP